VTEEAEPNRVAEVRAEASGTVLDALRYRSGQSHLLDTPWPSELVVGDLDSLIG